MILREQKERIAADMGYCITTDFLNLALEKGYIAKEAYDIFCKEISEAGAKDVKLEIESISHEIPVRVFNEDIAEILEYRGKIRMERGDCLIITVVMNSGKAGFSCRGMVRSSGR